MNCAVFLDRDGVINQAYVRDGRPYPPESVEELEFLPGVEQAFNSLSNAGYLLIVVTNQPDVARGKTDRKIVEAINQHIAVKLPITGIYTCYHDDSDNCDCRKPKPGALLTAAQDHQIDLKASYMVGDRWRDVESGNRAGCQTIFVDYGYSEKEPASANYHVKSTVEAVRIILEKLL